MRLYLHKKTYNHSFIWKYITYYIICQPNTTYTIQKVLGKQFRVGTSSEIPVVNGTLLQAWQNNDATQYTITTDSNAKYLCINIRNSSTDTLTEQQILDSLQIEKGSTASEYEEYKGQSYEINLGKNLFDINSNATTLGIEYSFDGSELSLNGATTNAGNIYNNNSNTILLKSGTYTFSTTTSGAFTRNGKDVAIYLRKKSDSSSVVELFSTQGYIIQQTFTINEDTELYMQLYTNGSGFVFDDFKIYLMLEKGSQSTSYSPYKTPIELCKIGDYKDRIYKDNNKWYIEKQIGKVVLNGSENWNNDGGTQGTDYRHNIYYASRMAIPSALGTSNTYLSNYFTQRNVGSDSGYLGSFYMSNGWLVFVDKNKVYDLDQWKTWLSTHNTTVYYVLATPTTTEITDSELISQLEEWYNQKSNKDVTYISVTSEDLPAILNVVAIKNYE